VEATDLKVKKTVLTGREEQHNGKRSLMHRTPLAGKEGGVAQSTEETPTTSAGKPKKELEQREDGTRNGVKGFFL